MKTIKTAMALALVFATGACDEAATGPDQSRGEVEVTLQGSGESAAQSSAPEGASFSRTAGEAQGQVDVSARVYVESSAGQWVELTRGAAEQTVDASGEASAKVLARARVKAGQYHRVRVEFKRVEARNVAWVQLGLGSTQGEARVEMGSDGEVVVERQVSLRMEAGASSQLQINLNAEQWLSHADAQTRTVSEAEFRNAVTISAR